MEYEVVDLQPSLRHLLLLARRDDSAEEKVLWGGRRHWFVCAVPERRRDRGGEGHGSASIDRSAHSSDAHIARHPAIACTSQRSFRQGEWFFIPNPDVVVNERLVRRNEAD
ncbi:MAG: hypothetical protein U0074_07690 [Kouleothrix sp.]